MVEVVVVVVRYEVVEAIFPLALPARPTFPRDACTFYETLSPERFLATSATVGPWGPKLSHGSPPAALLLRAIERAHPRE